MRSLIIELSVFTVYGYHFESLRGLIVVTRVFECFRTLMFTIFSSLSGELTGIFLSFRLFARKTTSNFLPGIWSTKLFSIDSFGSHWKRVRNLLMQILCLENAQQHFWKQLFYRYWSRELEERFCPGRNKLVFCYRYRFVTNLNGIWKVCNSR